MSLFSNVRFYILLLSFCISIIVLTVNTSEFVELQTFAFLAIFYLYITLLAGPLTKVITNIPFKAHYIKARRALGVSTFYFALIHYVHGLEILDWQQGILALPQNDQLISFLGTISIFILFLLAITSFDFAVQKLTFRWWKTLHRLVYLAGVFILIHAYMWGSHFQDRLSFASILTSSAVIVLLVLHMLAIKKKNSLQSSSNT